MQYCPPTPAPLWRQFPQPFYTQSFPYLVGSVVALCQNVIGLFGRAGFQPRRPQERTRFLFSQDGHSRENGNPVLCRVFCIPTSAGMTERLRIVWASRQTSPGCEKRCQPPYALYFPLHPDRRLLPGLMGRGSHYQAGLTRAQRMGSP